MRCISRFRTICIGRTRKQRPRSGIHVLCEKPMAFDEADCEAMITATEKTNVKLMIAYRLHFERGNLESDRDDSFRQD